MNRQELLSRLASRGWPVIYSNGPLSVWERGSQRWRESGWRSEFGKFDGVTVDFPGRIAPRWQSHDRWDRLSMRHHAGRLRRLAGENFAAYLFSPHYYDQLEYLKPNYVLFHVRDYYPGAGTWTREDQYRLEALAERADLITLAGREMGACIPPSARSKTRLLPNAADPSAFFDLENRKCPDDLAQIPGPKIGLIGNVNPKVDLGAMLRVARERPEWQFVVIGPVQSPRLEAFADHADNWQACLDTPNIHWLGARDHNDLPDYLVHMDANIMMYRIPTDPNSWVHFINPLKMFSYLAAGKPVISSDIPAVRRFAEVIDIAADHDGWIRSIERALGEGGIATHQKRRSIAFRNSWDNRVNDLEGWLFELLAAPQPKVLSGHSSMGVKPLPIPRRHFAVD